MKQSLRQSGMTFLDSFLFNNIILVQALGVCPLIAATTHLKYGVVLTVCTMLVLLPASVTMSLAKDRIPAWLRPPLYTIGASVLLLGAAWVLNRYISHELYAALYLFLPLMAVNTLLSYRAGGFSVQCRPVEALMDALGSSLGFGLVICAMSAWREIRIFGTLWDIPVNVSFTFPQAAMSFVGFIALGLMAALLQWLKAVVSRFYHR